MYLVREKCDFCGICVAVCPTAAILLSEGDLRIDEDVCTGCLNCVKSCPLKALEGGDEG